MERTVRRHDGRELFKLFSGDEPAMYEILLLTVEDGTLSLKVKHFNPDFTAWEEKGGLYQLPAGGEGRR